ncbi:MAG: flp pilus-assembly TadE/G-like family protein [Actinomycetota bacterium]|nr:flp pilus-assembly TadE/G-like family protein [Actinomycetota bacterium]
MTPGQRVAGGERGSATVWLLSVTMLVSMLTGVVLLVGAAAVIRHRVEAAADLAALAAAERAIGGPQAACTAAGRVAVEAGAVLVRCSVIGAVSEVTAARRPPGILGLAGPVTARSRAGPDDAVPRVAPRVRPAVSTEH